MAKALSPRWLAEPEDKDYTAARSFLSMLVDPGRLEEVIQRLREAPIGHWAAKDILRAAALPALRPKQSAEVAHEWAKIGAGTPISPVLLVGGLHAQLVVADGYHRVSAALRAAENTLVPGRLLWLG